VNPKSERTLLLLLAAIQFTTNLDFLIILPLGPQYMRLMHLTPAQFNLIVAAYAIAAGISGVVAGFCLDRFDRKNALLGLFLGFAAGTLLCALASSYPLLVAARALAGAFGGVTGAVILAIVGDVIPEHRRGKAMGLVMSAFSVASIFGVPLGLVLATDFSWHVPFYAIAGLCVPILLAVSRCVPALRGHLGPVREQHPWARMLAVLAEPNHRMAFVFMAALAAAAFTIFPTMAPYMVQNVGLTEKQLPFIYLTGGLCTFFSMNLIGRWADRSGKLYVFTLMSLSATIPITALTHLARVPLLGALATSTLLMICMSGRFVPAMAMMTAAVESRSRGGLMSINSSVQQFSCGLAAWLTGNIIG
jgi:predicted MFS family arabinose efflux permease